VVNGSLQVACPIRDSRDLNVRHERKFFNEVGDVRLKEEVKSETPSGEWIIVLPIAKNLPTFFSAELRGPMLRCVGLRRRRSEHSGLPR
jgi:hypothetical protein